MGDSCNIAFLYPDGSLDLSQYPVMLYRSRNGDPGSVGPLLGWCLLDVYELGPRENWSPWMREDHLIKKLCEYGFERVESAGEDIFQTTDNIDFFYAVNNSLQLTSYVSSSENLEIPLPIRTEAYLELERKRECDAKELGLEFSAEYCNIGLRRIQTIDLVRLLGDWDREPRPVKVNVEKGSASVK